MFFDCFEDAVCYMCGKGGVLEKTEKDGKETAFNEDAPIQPINVKESCLIYKSESYCKTFNEMLKKPFHFKVSFNLSLQNKL